MPLLPWCTFLLRKFWRACKKVLPFLGLWFALGSDNSVANQEPPSAVDWVSLTMLVPSLGHGGGDGGHLGMGFHVWMHSEETLRDVQDKPLSPSCAHLAWENLIQVQMLIL